MSLSRRSFLGAAAAAGLAGARLPAAAPTSSLPDAIPADRFDPWVEVDPQALLRNVETVGRLSGGRPVLAVVKNNAYGLELEVASKLLEPLPSIAGFAVVKPSSALALRHAGVRKPVLLMGMATDEESSELARRDVRLSVYTDDDARRMAAVRRVTGKPVDVHVYVDTGLGRMGIPYHRALPWLETLVAAGDVSVEGTFTTFTEETDFDPEQLDRFLALGRQAGARGITLGRLHAASSNAVFHLPDAHLDLVRPGIALYGAYPSRPEEERAKAELVPAFRLRTRVVRVERLRPGDGVSYGRNYVAERPVWTATLPVGHADGYPRRAVEGARVLIGEGLHPVIGAVSASHAIVELGDETTVRVGDVATLVGPDHPDIHPNAIAAATGVSVYDILMHLSPELPRVVV